MMLDPYETIYIIKPNITEKETTKTINTYRKFLQKNGAHNILVQNRGRRHLSYSIKNYYDGIYVQMNYDGNAYLMTLLEKFIRFDANIFRHINLKQHQNSTRKD
uniref:30S ribosomal protein S6, chloroplastic n=1 Tax=Hildenbrandia rubra TaxID=31481 RepID=A0A1C9CG95_9FLOR|nr:ribosomal protein S6 [Hildenbrandia rubra]AOM67395.1 ribosomal protein S6 [Hildenbrandia rubra]